MQQASFSHEFACVFYAKQSTVNKESRFTLAARNL